VSVVKGLELSNTVDVGVRCVDVAIDPTTGYAYVADMDGDEVNGGRADDSWERRLNVYLRPHLLILDDFGLKPLQPPAPEDLYDVINERYERGSILLTSNRAPAEWPDLFRDPLLASAGLDRLMHRAEVLFIRGTSFRAQGRQRLEQEVLSNQTPSF